MNRESCTHQQTGLIRVCLVDGCGDIILDETETVDEIERLRAACLLAWAAFQPFEYAADKHVAVGEAYNALKKVVGEEEP